MKNTAKTKPTDHKENGEEPAVIDNSKEPLATPATERYGLNHTQIKASHIKDHIMAAAESLLGKKPASSEQGVKKKSTHLPFGMIRRIIAERLTLSKRTIPHFHLTVDVDMTDLLVWRQKVNEDNSSRITITDLVVKAVAATLPEYERINAHVESDKLIAKKDINVGIVVAIEDGLMVPVIPNADQKSLQEISDWSKKLAEAARNHSINFHDVGTFTISTLGSHGVKNFQTIINPPECAILSVGSAEERAVVVDGEIQIRNMMSLNLTVDHRAVDGIYAAGFINGIKRRLENIEEL